jgi:hypothetical protein
MSAASFCQSGLEEAGERPASPIGVGEETLPAAAPVPSRVPVLPGDSSAGAMTGAGPIGVPEGRGLIAGCPGGGEINPLGDDAGGVGGARGWDADGRAPPGGMGGSSLGAALPRGGVVPNALPSKRSRFR